MLSLWTSKSVAVQFLSIYILNLKFYFQINKIVTKSTQDGTGIKAPALIFYPAGVKISRFLFKFAK